MHFTLLDPCAATPQIRPPMHTPAPILIRNALIKRAEIVYDLAQPRVEITLDYGNDVLQSTGSLELTERLVHRLLTLTHSTLWSQIPGKPVRANGTTQRISSIGDFLVDEWVHL